MYRVSILLGGFVIEFTILLGGFAVEFTVLLGGFVIEFTILLGGFVVGQWKSGFKFGMRKSHFILSNFIFTIPTQFHLNNSRLFQVDL